VLESEVKCFLCTILQRQSKKQFFRTFLTPSVLCNYLNVDVECPIIIIVNFFKNYF